MAMGNKYTQLLLGPQRGASSLGDNAPDVMQQGMRGYLYGQQNPYETNDPSAFGYGSPRWNGDAAWSQLWSPQFGSLAAPRAAAGLGRFGFGRA